MNRRDVVVVKDVTHANIGTMNGRTPEDLIDHVIVRVCGCGTLMPGKVAHWQVAAVLVVDANLGELRPVEQWDAPAWMPYEAVVSVLVLDMRDRPVPLTTVLRTRDNRFPLDPPALCVPVPGPIELHDAIRKWCDDRYGADRNDYPADQPIPFTVC